VAAAAVTANAPLELDDMQGLLLRGYANLRAACFLLYEVERPADARKFLAVLADRVTPASRKPAQHALHLAVTVPGLRRLGLPDAVVNGLPLEMREGMVTPHRSRILGDVHESAPDRWAFGGPSTPEVHVMLLVYGVESSLLAPFVDELAGDAQTGGLGQIARLETTDIGRAEHFGFHDGISQPRLEGIGGAEHGDDQTLRAGEVVLGYPDEYGLYALRPMVGAPGDPSGKLPPDAEGGPQHDLGRNGSYLVFRQLEQDVQGFWRYVDHAAAGHGRPPGAEMRLELASKLVGRWPGGAPLVLSPHSDDPALADSNDFRYHTADPYGQRCPLGSHVRRANPRDSLDPRPGTARSIEVANHHRLLRRGRSYGPRLPIDDALEREPDNTPRGLYFICLNTNLSRQFEFVQQTWVRSPKFAGLYDEPDPILAGGSFTIPTESVRRRLLDVPRFVTVRGGAYFFLPGIRAVRYLAALGGAGSGCEPGNTSRPVGS
jgi:Dyp-type peroxidase family